MPHTVYLLAKQSVEKPEVHIERAELSRTDNKVMLEVENTGNNFGRIPQTQLVYPKKKQQEAPGFPINTEPRPATSITDTRSWPATNRSRSFFRLTFSTAATTFPRAASARPARVPTARSMLLRALLQRG